MLAGLEALALEEVVGAPSLAAGLTAGFADDDDDDEDVAAAEVEEEGLLEVGLLVFPVAPALVALPLAPVSPSVRRFLLGDRMREASIPSTSFFISVSLRTFSISASVGKVEKL